MFTSLPNKIGGHKMTQEITVNHNDELVDTLTAISVISKQLARKIKEEEINEQNERTE